MTPRDVFPKKSGVKIGFLPGRERRPSRGARVPADLRRVKSSISGGRLLKFGTVESVDMAQTGVRKSRAFRLCSMVRSECWQKNRHRPSKIVNSSRVRALT